MAESARKTAKKTTPAKKVAAPARTSRRATSRTAAQPAAVEEEAVVAARRRPRADRPAAKAAAELRGDPTPSAAEQPPAADDDAPEFRGKTAVVAFRGRNVLVKLPNDEQLAMYRRMSREFQALGRDGNADNLSVDEALKYLDRGARLIQSVMVSDDDREWLEDQLLDGKLRLPQCNELMVAAFVALREANEEGLNRAARRSAGRRASLED